MKTRDKHVIATLALVPISIAASSMIWGTGHGLAFVAPAAASVLAALTAVDYYVARNVAWGCMVAQVLVMLALVFVP